jgi:hypothetical protein
MLEFFLGSISYILIIVGLMLFIASLLTNFIPFVAKYRLAVEIIAVILLCIGFWFAGIKQCEDSQRIDDMKLEHKVEVITEKSELANQTLEDKTEKQIEYVYIQGAEIIKEVPVIVTKEIDKNCHIPKELIELHNKMVIGEK